MLVKEINFKIGFFISYPKIPIKIGLIVAKVILCQAKWSKPHELIPVSIPLSDSEYFYPPWKRC